LPLPDRWPRLAASGDGGDGRQDNPRIFRGEKRSWEEFLRWPRGYQLPIIFRDIPLRHRLRRQPGGANPSIVGIRALSAALKINEESVAYLIARMVSSGKIVAQLSLSKSQT